MDTLTLASKLAELFIDIVLPLVVLWIGYSIKQWLPKESSTHREVTDLTAAVATFLRTQAALQSSAKPKSD